MWYLLKQIVQFHQLIAISSIAFTRFSQRSLQEFTKCNIPWNFHRWPQLVLELDIRRILQDSASVCVQFLDINVLPAWAKWLQSAFSWCTEPRFHGDSTILRLLKRQKTRIRESTAVLHLRVVGTHDVADFIVKLWIWWNLQMSVYNLQNLPWVEDFIIFKEHGKAVQSQNWFVRHFVAEIQWENFRKSKLWNSRKSASDSDEVQWTIDTRNPLSLSLAERIGWTNQRWMWFEFQRTLEYCLKLHNFSNNEN